MGKARNIFKNQPFKYEFFFGHQVGIQVFYDFFFVLLLSVIIGGKSVPTDYTVQLLLNPFLTIRITKHVQHSEGDGVAC